MSVMTLPSTKAQPDMIRPFNADSELRPKVVVTASVSIDTRDMGDITE